MFKISQNILLIILVAISCGGNSSQDIVVLDKKMNGLSFVASNNEVFEETIKPVVAVNANWVAMSPFGFMQTTNNPELGFNKTWQWWGEKIVGVKQTSQVFKEKGIKRMLKPQIWVRRGEFTGFIKMENEEDWLRLEANYEQFILAYAEVAEEENIELFCIGTELNGFVTARPDYWKKLIKRIKTIYKGKLTYAANWDTYQNPTFWEDLDYIGVDAYFPLSAQKTPSVEELKAAWEKDKTTLSVFSVTKQKPIIFTEFGYRSVSFTAKEPWDANVGGDYNVQAQKNALQALFETFWLEPWFEGGFLWKWFDNYPNAGGTGHKGFTIQNKESENLVKQFYGK